MSSSLYDIYSALSSLLSSNAGGSRIAWENTQFVPNLGETYLEPGHVLDTIQPASLGTTGLNIHRGLFQVNVVVPINSGAKVPLQKLDAIRTAFKRGTRIAVGSDWLVIEGSERPMPLPDKSWIRYPLLITWRCHLSD